LNPLLEGRKRECEARKTVRDVFDRMDPGPYRDLVAHAVESGVVKWEDPYDWEIYRRIRVYMKTHHEADERTIGPGLAG